MKVLPKNRNHDHITLSVLWHSTVLINIYGKWIITDPILFDKIWLKICKWKVGMTRVQPLVVSLEDLPDIDMILLSHTHMDHFDMESINRLVKRNYDRIKIICPHNTRSLLKNIDGISHIYTLDRDEEITIDEMHIKARETNHRGARRPWHKKKHTRWSIKSHSYNAYMISSHDKTIFFGGDTAYTDIYKDNWNDVDIAIMPIWAYDPRLSSHCNPQQALQMATDLWARYFVPIHCETFRLGREDIDMPRKIITNLISSYSDISLATNYIWDVFVLI